MDNTIQIRFNVVPTSPEFALGLAVTLDDVVVWQRDKVDTADTVIVDVADSDDTDHSLKLVVSGKLPEYTEIDEQGNIVRDSMLEIANLSIDDLDMSDHLFRFATYTHDCNGTADMRTEPMYRHLGCNGTVEIKFGTPIYLWLLEQM